MWKNLDSCEAFSLLKRISPPSLAPLLTGEGAKDRINKYSISMGHDMHYNYAAKKVNDKIIDVLQTLSEEQELLSKYELLRKGEVINTGENRMVLHHLTRCFSSNPVYYKEQDVHKFYMEELEKIRRFVDDVHNHKICSSSGEPFNNVVQLGIGGSDLGPRCLYIALESYAQSVGAEKMKAHFISNVDPEDCVSVLSKVDISHTLFILVSKSGNTEETLANQDLVLKFLALNGIKDAKKNIALVTSSTSPLAYDASYLASFFIDDFIGGRYSSTSACGALILSLSFGNKVFAELLEGATIVDKNATLANIRENAPLMDALIGVYECSVLGYEASAVLPYTQNLSRFPAHLQQLDMESSGKAVNRNFESISYPTGPIIFGEPGTNGQHSFYQFLHQSAKVVPLQFIAFRESVLSQKVSSKVSKDELEFFQCIKENHKRLLTHLVAQIYAFAVGKDDANKNKHFEGERPSSLIYGKVLDALSLGMLLSHFENKVMFQGFLWNINSFDQEGVQLGKTLAKKIRAGDVDEGLTAFANLLL